MKLSKIYEALVASEIFTYDLVDDEGSLRNEVKPRINRLINLGLSKLYELFVIREDTLKLNVTSDIQRYFLTCDNAQSKNPNGYILDSDNPFKGDILELLRIKLPDGTVRTLNGESPTQNTIRDVYHNVHVSTAPSLISTPSSDELLFGFIPEEGIYEIVYKADAIPVSMNAAITTEVRLPNTYLNALCYFVASKMYNPAGAESIGRSMFHEGNNWSSKFNEECRQLKENLAGNKTSIAQSNFQRGGWV